MSLQVAAVPPRKTLASEREDIFKPSCAAFLSESTRTIPSGRGIALVGDEHASGLALRRQEHHQAALEVGF
jgi:hypothetical protein